MQKLLAELWQQHYPAILERLQTLSAFIAAARQGNLGPTQRTEAQSAAHKLAGVLGTFRREEGTKLARTIEEMLTESDLSPSNLRHLESLTSELRRRISL